MPKNATIRKIRLRPADPFDLIRLLAQTQHDPRKAMCELVQNSLDARATEIDLEWFNDKGARALRVSDNGEGIFPGMSREEALTRIARTIGHSHKRALTPDQRRELMLLGKYGIGLLGFWSVARSMEIRSRVGGGDAWVLRLHENSPHGEVSKSPARRLVETDTFTQITLRSVKDGAQRLIRPARLASFLASELRGQLLRRPVRLAIRDRIARGASQKLFAVEPKRFRGKLLENLEQLSVPGFNPASLELYMLPAEELSPGRVALACGGTTVLDDIAFVDHREGGRPPWNLGRLEGVIDAPDLSVAPGTRREVQQDEALLAFLNALESLEQDLLRQLADDEKRREEERLQNIAGQIRRAFVAVATALPDYDIPDVRAGGKRENAATPAGEEGKALGGELDEDRASSPTTNDSNDAEQSDQAAGGDQDAARDESDAAELFPPGPLATVDVTPARSVIAPGTKKRLTARARDAAGRVIRDNLHWSWHLNGGGRLEPRGGEAHYLAGAADGEAIVEATASQDGVSVIGTALIKISEAVRGQERTSGIPEPHALHAPLESWRSRILGTRWEYNTAHRDYLAAAENPSRRLRYFVHLFTKELVLRNFGVPQDAAVLERMIEVLTHLGAVRMTPQTRVRDRPETPAADARGGAGPQRDLEDEL